LKKLVFVIVDVAGIDTLVRSSPTIAKETFDWEVRGLCLFASLGDMGNPMQPNGSSTCIWIRTTTSPWRWASKHLSTQEGGLKTFQNYVTLNVHILDKCIHNAKVQQTKGN
jgi:hypothetical protein